MLQLNPIFIFGVLVLPLTFLFIYLGLKIFTVSLQEETECLVIQFGQIIKKLTNPGLNFVPQKKMPGTHLVFVSKHLDFRNFIQIPVDDQIGTTIFVNLWIEFQIVDAYKSYFKVENWEEAFRSSVTNAVASILSTQTFHEILSHRLQLSEKLQQSIENETSRWGIKIHQALIQNVNVLPELSQQMSDAVSAKITRRRALIEEESRIHVAELEAQTTQEIAQLNGLGRIQNALSIMEAYKELSKNPKLLMTFQKYWKLNQWVPGKTVAIHSGKTESVIVDAITQSIFEKSFSLNETTIEGN